MPNGHEINDADCYAFLNQCSTLGNKGIPMLGTIFVRGTNDLQRRNQTPTPLYVVDSDFVFVKIGELRLDGEARRRPHGGCYASVSFTDAVGKWRIVVFKSRDVDFDLRARVNSGLGYIPGWKVLSQLLDDNHRPTAVEALPRSDVIQRRAKVIA
jgi:hypothetical protein